MNRRSAACVLVGISIVVAAIATAAISHVLIDVLGDVLLAHDTYDDVDHRSRAIVVAGGASVVAAALLRLWCAAFSEVRRPRGAMRAILADASQRANSGVTLVATIALALLGIVTMEIFDVARAGGSEIGARAALGGSFWLGLGVTAFVGTCLAMLVPRTLRCCARAFDFFVIVVREAFVERAPATRRSPLRARRAGHPPPSASESILSRRAGKRAPPPSLRAV